MTEDEAKTKWCPFARTMVALDETDSIGHAGNRMAHNGELGLHGSLCIGSACMEWRWKDCPIAASPATTHARHRPGQNPEYLLVPVAAIEGRVGDGYCGLAGPG